ncbi:small ribosomal subunit protein mS39 [Oratosquilla oratoria]|uniref:small ribosomal subunit protein mS39 n=1 Tax=Oratosquilla oratoria TaxID=337810 RepID=UPI003F7687B1
MAGVRRKCCILLQNVQVLQRIPCQNLRVSAIQQSKDIVIPKRIHRGPTDILEALAATVSRETSLPHYKYNDDPYLMPTSNLDKRAFSLSKESGRKAARWVRDKHGDLFNHQPDDPVIEAFIPKVTFTEESTITEETLQDLINKCLVSDAVTVYEICQTKGIAINMQTKLALLEFLCYFNCKDPLDEDWVEERWYHQGVQGKERYRKTWKDNGLAETVFKEVVDHHPSEAFCALIQGMAKHYQIDRAWQTFQEANEKKIPLDTQTYNAIIAMSARLREGSDMRWELIQELLSSMESEGFSPNLGTLNSVLEVLSQMGSWRKSREMSLKVLKEFTRLGMEPSLVTYYYLLIIHCRERGPVNHILLDILDHIKDKEFTIQHPKDTFFFVTAMDVCRNHLQDMSVAQQLDQLLHTGSNYKLIGDSYKESIYYRHYFALACAVETIENIMNLYDELVPNIYTPEPGIMEEMVKATKVHGTPEYLPRLWSDMIMFDHVNRERLVTAVLSGVAMQDLPIQDNPTLTEQLSTVVWDIWTRIQGQDEFRYNKITWTGKMLGDVLSVLVRCNNYKKAVVVMNEVMSIPNIVVGVLPLGALQVLLTSAFEHRDAKMALNVTSYAADSGFPEAGDFAVQLVNSIPLSVQERAKLTTIVGTDLVAQVEKRNEE